MLDALGKKHGIASAPVYLRSFEDPDLSPKLGIEDDTRSTKGRSQGGQCKNSVSYK